MAQKKSITIPLEFRFFSEPTAIICLNHDRAKVYEATSDTLREIAFLHTSDTDFQYSDKESFSHAEGSSSIFFKPGTEEHNKEHYIRVFLNYFAKKLQNLDQERSFHDIYLFLPGDVKNIVSEKLLPPVQEKTHVILGNVIHEHPLELLKRIAVQQ